MLDLLASLCAGIIVGIFTGLAPGIHSNLVAAVIVANAAALSGLGNPVVLAVFLVSLGVTHSLLDIVPSIFLGAPDPSTVLAVLPGHRMFLQGFGYEAVKLALTGSLLGLLATLTITPAIFIAFSFLDRVLKPWLALLLISALVYSLAKEPSASGRFWATIVVALSGTLGVTILSSPAISDPLFPLLTGLFGTSSLLLSLKEKSIFAPQRVTDMVRIPSRQWIVTLISGSAAGIAGALLPGLGPSHTAGLAALPLGQLSPPRYLALTGALGTVNFTVSLITFAAAGKARNGVIASMQEFIPELSIELMAVLLVVAVISASTAVILALATTKKIVRIFSRVPYQKMVIIVLFFLTMLSIVLCGMWGVAILVVATAIGLLPGVCGCAHQHAMGCLLVPVILFFLGL